MQFTLPESVFRKAERLAQDRGFASVGDYVSELVERDDSAPLPNRSAELEAALITGLDSGPPTLMTRADWDDLKRRVQEAHAKRPAAT